MWIGALFSSALKAMIGLCEERQSSLPGFGVHVTQAGEEDKQVAPSFGGSLSGSLQKRWLENNSGNISGGFLDVDEGALVTEDELLCASPCERVYAVAEQLTEFLSRFSLEDQALILEPFLKEIDLQSLESEAAVDPHIDEAREFIRTFLDANPQIDGRLALSSLSKEPPAYSDEVAASGDVSMDFLRMRRKVGSSPERLHRRSKISIPGSEALVIDDVLASFQRCDPSGRGVISRADLVHLFTELNPSLSAKDVEGMLEQQWPQDAVSFSEFLVWLCQ